jgi:Tfp pilus assembly protein PilE
MPKVAAGFTVVEIVISLALLALIFGLGIVVSIGSYQRALGHSQVATVVALLQSARERSMNNVDQHAWSASGVTFSQLSGTTTPTTLSITEGSKVSTIYINAEGRIDW